MGVFARNVNRGDSVSRPPEHENRRGLPLAQKKNGARMTKELTIGPDIRGAKMAFVLADRLGEIHHRTTLLFTLSVPCFNLLGDGLRGAFGPTTKD